LVELILVALVVGVEWECLSSCTASLLSRREATLDSRRFGERVAIIMRATFECVGVQRPATGKLSLLSQTCRPIDASEGLRPTVLGLH
jgi:hypothetical protein